MPKRIIIYTDASHDCQTATAACGNVVVIFNKIVSHNVYLVSGIEKSSDAELYAITLALKDLVVEAGDTVIVKTDHQGNVVKQAKSRNSLHMEHKATLKLLVDAGVKVQIKFVKGHSTNEYNNLVDRGCRKHLREHNKVREILQKSVPK